MSSSGPGPEGSVGAGGFLVPEYPYDRLIPAREKAAALPGGAVDLSIGTPCDPPPDSVLAVLADADRGGAMRGYPPSVGTAALRLAISAWLGATFGVSVPESAVGVCVGTKELVAGLPHFLHLRRPERDTVLYPAVSYPTYEMGARLAGLRAVPVPSGPVPSGPVPSGPGASADEYAGGLDLDAIDPSDAARALMLWVNSPANPTGVLTDLSGAAAWGRAHDVPVFSDECYVELTWDRTPETILGRGGGPDGLAGVVAVHSLSKRSNLAGLRVGWYSGDPDLVGFLREVRKHAGFMVPGPAQAAGVAALADVGHAGAQRARYRRRLERMQAVLSGIGVDVPLPAGAFYLWGRAPEGDAWAFTDRLAAEGGVIVSPGEFYGPFAPDHFRVAMVAPDERLDLVVSRLGEGA